jgi:hypothetical protein
MAKYATGKYSQSISDRSGQAFPYNEMLKEWNGSWVHISEYDPKHPQIRRKHTTSDAIALRDVRPQKFQQPLDRNGVFADSGGAVVGVANLTLPGDFAFTNQGISVMKPADPSDKTEEDKLLMQLNKVTVVIS